MSRLLAFGGFDPLSGGRAAARARAYIRRLTDDPSPRLGIITSAPAEATITSLWCDRASRSGFRPEAISLDTKDAGSRLLSKAVLHFPAGHTAHLLHRLRPLAGDLKGAWDRGLLLSGSSGGGLCWFSFLWSASMFGEPEWIQGLSFAPEAASAHHDQVKYRRPSGKLPVDGSEPATIALDHDVLLDWTPERLKVIAIRPGAHVHVLDNSGGTLRVLKGRDLSPLFGWLIRMKRAVSGRVRT